MPTDVELELSPDTENNRYLTLPANGMVNRRSSSTNSINRRSSSSDRLPRRRPVSANVSHNSTPANHRSVNSTPANHRSRSTIKSSANASLELPTDQSDNTEDDEDFPVECSGHDHLDIPVIDEVINIPVDTLYDMIFGDHDFYKHFQHIKKTTALVLPDWSEPDDEGDKTRTLTYTVAINHSMGPKSASTTEKQIIRNYSRPGSCYVVDAEAYTAGVPYGDSFYLLNRFCFTKTTDQVTRLRITSSIIYLKKVWGLIKKFIETNVKSGTIESYKLLGRLLHEEAEKIPPPRSLAVKRRKKIKRHSKEDEKVVKVSKTLLSETRRLAQREINNNTVHTIPTRHKPHTKSKTEDVQAEDNSNIHIRLHVDTLAKCVFFLVFLLVLINIALYYKLSAVQEKANLLTKARINLSSNTASNDGEGEWQSLFSNQQKNHEADIDKWGDVLTASAKIMDTMHKTLLELQASISHHQSSAKERYTTQDSTKS